MGLKGGISIDADSGPLGYVLWCCGSRSLEVFTFIQIGSGHTVGMCHKPALKRQKICWLNLITFLRVRSTIHVISCRHVLAWNSCNLFDIWAGPKNCHGSHPQDEYATLLLWSNYLLDTAIERRLPTFLKNEIGYIPFAFVPLENNSTFENI